MCVSSTPEHLLKDACHHRKVIVTVVERRSTDAQSRTQRIDSKKIVFFCRPFESMVWVEMHS